MKLQLPSILIAITLLTLSGCTASHLVYVQESSIGLTVGLGAEGAEKISLGYDRDAFAIVPKKGATLDAMSLLSVNKVEMSGLRTIKVSEFVAAGAPAIKLVQDPEAIAKLRSEIYGGAPE